MITNIMREGEFSSKKNNAVVQDQVNKNRNRDDVNNLLPHELLYDFFNSMAQLKT